MAVSFKTELRMPFMTEFELRQKIGCTFQLKDNKNEFKSNKITLTIIFN